MSNLEQNGNGLPSNEEVIGYLNNSDVSKTKGGTKEKTSNTKTCTHCLLLLPANVFLDAKGRDMAYCNKCRTGVKPSKKKQKLIIMNGVVREDLMEKYS